MAPLDDGRPEWLPDDPATSQPTSTIKDPKKPSETPLPFPLLWFEEIQPVLTGRDFVEGLLVEGSAVVVYGKSNAGKTFWVGDLALHVAASLEWNGRAVDGGGVIYVCMEGANGFRNRVAAWRRRRGISEPIPFGAVTSTVNMLQPGADTDRLIETIKQAAERIGQPVKLIVIDTLSRALAGGNENAPEDMGALVKNMDRIRAETGACVLFVHHSGKDEARGARGHSLLQAAIDTEIEVADDKGNRTATVVKQRDLPKGDCFSFTLTVVELGLNQRSKPVTSCVVEPAASTSAAACGKLTADQRALGFLADVIARSGQRLPSCPGFPDNVRGATETAWREECDTRRLSASDDKEARSKAFRRAYQTLLDKKKIAARDGWVWIVRPAAD